VTPTDEGRRLAATAVAAVREVEGRFLAELSPGERDSLLSALRRLSQGPLGTAADLSGIPAAPRRRPRRGDPR
jgi:hypothetical protein